MEAKNVDVEEAMGMILTMENEFEIFLPAHLTTLWQHTLRLEYGRVTDGRMEANYGLLTNEDTFQTEALSNTSVRDFRSTVLQN
eukprot:2586896-Alexandrium_andersonii.AAC.1